MTRTLRWTRSLCPSRLSRADRSNVLLRWLYPQQGLVHWWWSLPTCSEPSSLAGQRWLEWSCSCLFSNWLRWVDRSQSPSIGLSIDEWVPAKIEDHRKACASPLSMPNTRHSPWRRLQRRAWGLASSTSLLGAHGSSQCQNGRPAGRRDAGWWVLSKWPLAQKFGPDSAALHQYPNMAHLRVVVVSVPELWSWFLTALVAGAACYQYWPCRSLRWLAPSGTCPKNYVAAVAREFRRWGPDLEVIVWMKRWVLRDWDLQGLPLSVRFANNEKFECSQLKAFFPHPGFSEENERVHLQLYSLYPDNNRFENGNDRASGPSGPDKSSNFSCPWIVGGYYGQWEQGLCVWSLLGSDAKSWKLYRWPKVHHREFGIKFWPESFFENSRPPDDIGPSQ